MPSSVITVQHRDGGAVRKVRVSLGFVEGNARPAYTDDHGTAIIDHASTGRATVYVSGRSCGSFHAPGRTSVII